MNTLGREKSHREVKEHSLVFVTVAVSPPRQNFDAKACVSVACRPAVCLPACLPL